MATNVHTPPPHDDALHDMPPTPFRTAQTSSEAKKQHKKQGPCVPHRQQKQLERLVELDNRAARIRENDERRRAAKKRREEQERKQKQARKQQGVGLATQLIGYSHTQARLKNGMEAFLGVNKRDEAEKRRKDAELAKQLEAIAERMEKEPWDDDEGDGAFDMPVVLAAGAEQWADDDLDDDTLLEAHDLLMSDPVDEASTKPQPAPAPAPPTPLAVAPTLLQPCRKEDADFTRIHGPINKPVDAMLHSLPDALVELLSLDLSMRQPNWNPAPALLHKLNPIGLPPHRLRIKAGCVVILLRDLNTSSQLSRSQHLRVLRIESERLECLVLDGQLEGTKAFLTRIPFLAKYRNDEQFIFKRTQFPIRIAHNYKLSDVAQNTCQSGFKLPSVPGWRRPPCAHKRLSPPVSIPKPQTVLNSTFKRPGLPASKSAIAKPTEPAATPKPTALAPYATDEWDDFLESGTQIARELSAETKPTPVNPTVALPLPADCLPPLSTQDFDFSPEDLDDEQHQEPVQYAAKHAINTSSVVPPRKPVTNPQHTPRTISMAGKTTSAMPHPAPPTLKRKAHTTQARASLPPPKQLRVTPPFPHNPLVSFRDFGLSTQDVVSSFFDDDDAEFGIGSPPIPV